MAGIVEQLEQASIYGPIPCPVAREAAQLLREIHGFLTAAADGSMSRNNSEELAGELLLKMAVDPLRRA